MKLQDRYQLYNFKITGFQVFETITGCIYLKQTLKFTAPVYPNDTVDVIIEVKSIDLKTKRVVLNTTCFCSEKKVIDGYAEILVMSKSNTNETYQKSKYS